MTVREQLEKHHPEAWNWARQCCRYQNEWAHEVLQITYLKVLEEKALFHGKSTFKTWLFSVIRLTAVEFANKQIAYYRQHHPIEGIPEITSDGQNVHENNSYEQLVRQLPERQAEVLLLIFYHGLTIERAAEVIETSVGTARTHYDRGKKKLKELILASTLKKAI